ncbi:MAG: T9SS type A sorting domain-containing protein, partial [Bacteroidales bacterium]|nr:T9SS type A sorting domain-containing protein [Bacteroidales bacterium]
GLDRMDSILYAGCREYGVKGCNLFTSENVLTIGIPGATNINDITADNSGNLYVSYPPGDVVYKINIASEQFWVFAENSLDFPNGIYFEEENNRLLLVSYRMNSTIQQISLADSTVSLITDPGLHNLDGITRGNDGDYYVSSWYTNSVYKFDGAFENPPEVFSAHNGDPADIFFDKVNNVLAVPLFFTHQLEFVAGPVTGLFTIETIGTGYFVNVYNSPNPFTASTAFSIQISDCYDLTHLEILIYNINGEKIKTLPLQISNSKLTNPVNWNGTDDSGNTVPPGIYFCSISTNAFHRTIKIVKK